MKRVVGRLGHALEVGTVGLRCEAHAASTDPTLLKREMYAAAEAARLLNVAPSTLRYWLEGKAGRAGKDHLPVIRQEPQGAGAAATWADFVEAGLLRQYRRERRFRAPATCLRRPAAHSPKLSLDQFPSLFARLCPGGPALPLAG